MEGGLKDFIKAYANAEKLEELDIAFLAGAMAKDSIEKLPQYAHFLATLGQIAPQLLHYIQLAGKKPTDEL